MPPTPPRRSAVRLLLAHDLMLGWRDFRSSFRLLDDRVLAILVILLLLVMHAAAWSTGASLADDGATGGPGHSALVAKLAPAVAFVLLLMLAQTLNGLTKALYGRGDLDLLLSSPFPARAVLLVRALAVALGAGASAAIFVVPVADVGLLHGAWRSLALFPALAGGALLASAASLAIVMAMFATLGPRRTRLAAQIAATFAGGGFMIWLQISRFVPASRMTPNNHLVAAADVSGAWSTWLNDLWHLPVRAAAGEGASLAVWLGVCVGLYILATLGFAGRFAASVVSAASIPAEARSPHSSPGGRDVRFTTRLGTCLRLKEWRLIRRDPWLLSQLLLQILYMTPMLVMVLNGTGAPGSIVVALAPMIVVVSYQVSASMTWLSLSAEDAPELLATAPVTESALQWGKLVAVGQLTAMLATGPLLWLAIVAPRAAALTAVLSGLAVAMAMQLSVWHTRPSKRAVFAARHRESKLLALMEMVMSMLMGVATALVVVASLWGLLPFGMALVILAVNRPRRRHSGALPGQRGGRSGSHAATPDPHPRAGRQAA